MFGKGLELYWQRVRGKLAEMRPLLLALFLCLAGAANVVLASDLNSTNWIGTGVIIQVVDHSFLVTEVIPNSPAQEAGVLPKDKITEVDGKNVYGLDLSQLLDLMRGPLNSSVKLTVNRAGSPGPLTFSMLRKPIHVDSLPKPKVVD
jgi:C-terminal processing protease CtpA/Prc